MQILPIIDDPKEKNQPMFQSNAELGLDYIPLSFHLWRIIYTKQCLIYWQMAGILREHFIQMEVHRVIIAPAAGLVSCVDIAIARRNSPTDGWCHDMSWSVSIAKFSNSHINYATWYCDVGDDQSKTIKNPDLGVHDFYWVTHTASGTLPGTNDPSLTVLVYFIGGNNTVEFKVVGVWHHVCIRPGIESPTANCSATRSGIAQLSLQSCLLELVPAHVLSVQSMLLLEMSNTLILCISYIYIYSCMELYGDIMSQGVTNSTS